MSMFQVQVIFKCQTALDKAREAWIAGGDDLTDAYMDAWVKYCAAFLDGDCTVLDQRSLSPEEVVALRGFFDGLAVGPMKTLSDALNTSGASAQQAQTGS
jgi:hypothetical protein